MLSLWAKNFVVLFYVIWFLPLTKNSKMIYWCSNIFIECFSICGDVCGRFLYKCWCWLLVWLFAITVIFIVTVTVRTQLHIFAVVVQALSLIITDHSSILSRMLVFLYSCGVTALFVCLKIVCSILRMYELVWLWCDCVIVSFFVIVSSSALLFLEWLLIFGYTSHMSAECTVNRMFSKLCSICDNVIAILKP